MTQYFKNGGDFEASNPAKIRLQMFRFFFVEEGKAGLICFGVFGIFLLLAILFRGWLLWGGAALFAFLSLRYCVGSKWKYRVTTVCPAVVLSRNPYWMASYANLAGLRNDEYPVIQIRSFGVHKRNGEIAPPGTRFAILGEFQQYNDDESRWESCGVMLPEDGTSDAKTLKRVLNSITEEEWAMLDRGVQLLSKPYEHGTYPLFELESGKVKKKKRKT